MTADRESFDQMTKKVQETIGLQTQPLGHVIDSLRVELLRLEDESTAKDLKFRIGEIEVALQVGITVGADGKLGFDCWLYKAEGNAGIERVSTQTVKLKLIPIWKPDGSGLIRDESNLPPISTNG